MGVIESKIYECDCCGRQSKSDDFNTGSVCGAGNLTLSGHKGGMAYNGDWGGSNYDLRMLLCFSCAEKIKEHISSLKRQSLEDINPAA